jgi:hypothetical protein
MQKVGLAKGHLGLNDLKNSMGLDRCKALDNSGLFDLESKFAFFLLWTALNLFGPALMGDCLLVLVSFDDTITTKKQFHSDDSQHHGGSTWWTRGAVNGADTRPFLASRPKRRYQQ